MLLPTPVMLVAAAMFAASVATKTKNNSENRGNNGEYHDNDPEVTSRDSSCLRYCGSVIVVIIVVDVGMESRIDIISISVRI